MPKLFISQHALWKKEFLSIYYERGKTTLFEMNGLYFIFCIGSCFIWYLLIFFHKTCQNTCSEGQIYIYVSLPLMTNMKQIILVLRVIYAQ